MELQWTANGNVSVYHTAWCIAHFPTQTEHCQDSLRTAALALDKLCGNFHVPKSRFWDQLLTLSATVHFTSDLAKRVMARTGLSSPHQQALLAGHLNECRRAFEGCFPKFGSEIPLRAGPLRQLWEAQGPGLLRMIARTTDEGLLVENAEVTLVQPILGGFGYAHLVTNRIHFEAVLINAAPELPETLRLAWLLAQLDLERPVYSELINTSRLRSLAGLAMLPVVLTAGQELDVCRCTTELIEQAVALWQADTLELKQSHAAAVLTSWWETYQAARPEWRIALTGLDKMLS